MSAGNRTHPSGPLDPCGKTAQRQAAEWLALRQARRLTAPEEKSLTAWLAADPRNEAMFREVEAASQIFDRLAFYPRDPDAPVNPDLLVRRRRLSLVPALLATAAAVAVVAVFWQQTPPPAPIEPPALAMAGSHFLRLPDGSRVELNAGSVVAEHFTAAERRVRLVRGEAHFEVAKNPLRPFIVEADNVAVRAVGTAFDVRLGAAAVHVLVTEGKVGVTSSVRPLRPSASREPAPAALGPGLILVAGERTVVPTAAVSSEPASLVIETVAQSAIDRALAWQSSRLVFDELPLSEVVARFNHSASEQDGAAAVHLSIADRNLAGLRFSGRIRADSVENFIDALEKNFGVAAERRGSEIILRQDR